MLSSAAILTVTLLAAAGGPPPPVTPTAEVAAPVPPVSPTPPNSPEAPPPTASVKWVSGAPGAGSMVGPKVGSKAGSMVGSTGGQGTSKSEGAVPAPDAKVTTAPPIGSVTAVARSARRHRAKSQRPPSDSEPGVSHASLTAPSLSGEAFRAELAHPGSDDGATKSAPDDRARLEKLSAEIAAARAGLREDTARLETTLHRSAGASGDSKGQVAEPEPHATPDGQPAPGAARGLPTVASTARGQIEIVSKELAGIKPEQAAAILSHLDRVLAAEVLRRMKAADAGAAMARLAPEMAAEIATEIATRLPPLEAPKDRP